MVLVLLVAGPATAQDYRFPTSEADYPFWYPTAYKDDGGHDWACGDIFYPGHNGSDFGGGGFAGMAEGRDIVAAADGVVDYTFDGVADDCTSGDCPGGDGFGNWVRIVHADGKVTYYGHMRTWSVAVSAGQPVSCGEKLGEMGSSGHSTGPHLHFEVRVSGGASDPFYGDCSGPPSYWVDQGAHGGLPALACDGSSPCSPLPGPGCGETLSSSNDDAGSTASVISYACTDYDYTGPEIAFLWTSAWDEDVTATLDGLSADLDLFVLPGPDCAPSACLAASVHPNSEAEAVTWSAVAGSSYVVVVDGWDGAVSAFQLGLACTPPGDDDDEGPDDDSTPDDDSASDDDSADPPGDGAFLDRAERLGALGEGAACADCALASGGRTAPGSAFLLGLLALGASRRRRGRRPGR